MNIRLSFRLLLATVGMTVFSALTASAADSAIEKLVDRVRDIYEQNKTMVVRVVATDRYGKLCGTGFFIDPSGTIYTLGAIVDGATDIKVYHGNKVFTARMLVSDSRSGIAILKVDTLSAFFPTKGAGPVDIATPVVSIGYPMDLPSSPTFGIVAGFDRKYLGLYFNTTHIRANMPVQQGQGGSPVLDIDGKLVGIVVSCLNNGTGCYILPIEAAEKIRNEYTRFGTLKPGWIGVHVEDVTKAENGSTARVAELDIDSPANGSGIQLGDILLKIGNSKISSAEDVLDASYFLTAGDSTPITVSRQGKEYTMQVAPHLHPIALQKEHGTNLMNFFVGRNPAEQAAHP
ncbi:MAG: S1C family serine protease [Chthoniobacterales bacterium]